MPGAGAGNLGAAGGGSLSGIAALSPRGADGKGVACAGPALSGGSRGVGAGGATCRSGSGGAFFTTFFAKTVGTEDTSGGCGVSGGEMVGAGASDSGTDGGVALSGVASLRSLVVDGKGVACAGASLAGVSGGVGAGGVA